MTRLPPLPMRPVFVEKIWGGSRLAALPAKQRDGHRPPTGKGIGESWEVADLAEGNSTVDDDAVCRAFAGEPLGALVQRFGRHLVGTAHPPDRFPILVKLIDAAEDLSVQVHPGAGYARAHPGTFSKDEAWWVVDAARGGRVLHGFVEGVSRRLFVDAVRMGLCHELMRSIDVKKGDVLHVSPGVVHAIGAGVVVLEVQEPSDTTFRVWDFNRKENGKPRQLHLEQALDVALFSDVPGAQPPPLSTPRFADDGVVTLVETRSFTMKAVVVNGEGNVDVAVDEFAARVVHAEDGDVEFAWDGIPVTLPRGGSCVLPASCGGVTFPARGRPVRLIVMS
jgi:mannose-6-phosphate isomerase